MKNELINRIFIAERELNHGAFRQSLPPFVGECAGARLCKKLGIGCADEIRLASRDEAIELTKSGDWIPKMRVCGRLRFVDDLRYEDEKNSRDVVLIKKIRGAISLYSLRKKYGVVGRAINMHGDDAHFDTALSLWADLFRSGSLRAYLVEDDFVLPFYRTRLAAAIEWDSRQMLAIHAARLFLGCSAAHAGNVLVDGDGRLYSIDHEDCSALDGSDLTDLFDNVQPQSRAWEALQGVAKLTDADIAALFDDLPVQGVAWPLGSLDATVSYFTQRLNYWRERFYAS